MAILNHDKKFIFIHVPRTGGHSAYELLGGKSEGALHPRRIVMEERYFSFGFVRNPWGRMYSLYRRQKVMPKYKHVVFKEYLLERLKGNHVENCAMWFLSGCDFIGRYENLQADWDYILNRIGMTPRTLPHLNKYGDADYQKHYDNEMIEHIALHHKPDIDWGGYTF